MYFNSIFVLVFLNLANALPFYSSSFTLIKRGDETEATQSLPHDTGSLKRPAENQTPEDADIIPKKAKKKIETKKYANCNVFNPM